MGYDVRQDQSQKRAPYARGELENTEISLLQIFLVFHDPVIFQEPDPYVMHDLVFAVSKLPGQADGCRVRGINDDHAAPISISLQILADASPEFVRGPASPPFTRGEDVRDIDRSGRRRRMSK
jgi:hypothetical protein